MTKQGCMVGIVEAGGRFVLAELKAAEAAGTAVVAVQRQGQERQKELLVWVVPGLEVVLEVEPEAVLEPELSGLAGRVRWRGLA